MLEKKYCIFYRPLEPGRGEAAAPLPQSFVKVDLLLIDNDSEKEKIASKYKLVQIPWRLLVTLLLPSLYNA